MSFPQSNDQTYLDYNETAAIQSTLPRFFNLVYTWMFVGLAITATVAMLGSRSTALLSLMTTPYVPTAIFLAALAFSWVLQSNIEKISPNLALLGFLVYAAVLGAVLCVIPLIYPMSSLALAFGITAGLFGAMSLIGFVTKKDLTSIGSIAAVCIMGLIVASLANLFLQSSMMDWIITYGIVILFPILIAYKTQQLKEIAYATANDPRRTAQYAIVGSMILYISFLNLFLAILRIMGGKR